MLSDPDTECLFSVASVWEMAIKANLGKLGLAIPVNRYVTEHLAANGFKLLEISLTHVTRVGLAATPWGFVRPPADFAGA
jgi:PIN domain nuclease of toxin-antitoxin system